MEGQVIVQGPGGTATARRIHLVEEPADLQALSSPLAWRILSELRKQPDFPGSLAKRLRVHEQKVYYHIRRLSSAGVLKVVREEQRRGATCRFYAPVAEAFGVQLQGKGRQVTWGVGAVAPRARDLLDEFAVEGVLDATIVVGSPYSHGPFLTAARDSPYAVQLGFLLGQVFAPPKGLVVRLDTEVKAEGLERANMVLVGGPVANIVSLDVNQGLKVKFEWRDAWKIKSDLTGRVYTEDLAGLIAKVPNPWSSEKRLLLLWGLHHSGTLAAILGVTNFADKALSDYHGGDEYYRVVLGLDRDGDGKVDDIEVLE